MDFLGLLRQLLYNFFLMVYQRTLIPPVPDVGMVRVVVDVSMAQQSIFSSILALGSWLLDKKLLASSTDES